VGRTKIITVHSGIWLKNSTDRRLRFRLHVPITSLVAPAGQDSGAHPQLALDNMIGPLQPDAGAVEDMLQVGAGKPTSPYRVRVSTPCNSWI
jgi:hypothetical protein